MRSPSLFGGDARGLKRSVTHKHSQSLVTPDSLGQQTSDQVPPQPPRSSTASSLSNFISSSAATATNTKHDEGSYSFKPASIKPLRPCLSKRSFLSSLSSFHHKKQSSDNDATIAEDAASISSLESSSPVTPGFQSSSPPHQPRDAAASSSVAAEEVLDDVVVVDHPQQQDVAPMDAEFGMLDQRQRNKSQAQAPRAPRPHPMQQMPLNGKWRRSFFTSFSGSSSTRRRNSRSSPSASLAPSVSSLSLGGRRSPEPLSISRSQSAHNVNLPKAAPDVDETVNKRRPLSTVSTTSNCSSLYQDSPHEAEICSVQAVYKVSLSAATATRVTLSSLQEERGDPHKLQVPRSATTRVIRAPDTSVSLSAHMHQRQRNTASKTSGALSPPRSRAGSMKRERSINSHKSDDALKRSRFSPAQQPAPPTELGLQRSRSVKDLSALGLPEQPTFGSVQRRKSSRASSISNEQEKVETLEGSTQPQEASKAAPDSSTPDQPKQRVPLSRSSPSEDELLVQAAADSQAHRSLDGRRRIKPRASPTSLDITRANNSFISMTSDEHDADVESHQKQQHQQMPPRPQRSRPTMYRRQSSLV